MKTAFNRHVNLEEISKQDFAMICMIKNINNLLETFQIAASEIQIESYIIYIYMQFIYNNIAYLISKWRIFHYLEIIFEVNHMHIFYMDIS